ncbi:hypothetical protein J6590_036617 [Homalodisca vitripennis]|nr:hypothetical protein J6590_036617 [Homalodisca vitripennis]
METLKEEGIGNKQEEKQQRRISVRGLKKEYGEFPEEWTLSREKKRQDRKDLDVEDN